MLTITMHTDAVPFKYEAGVESGGGKLQDLDNEWGQVFRTDKLKNCLASKHTHIYDIGTHFFLQRHVQVPVF